MIKKQQEAPKWFNGEIYEEGATVSNPFSGEEYKLTGIELSIYDFILGTQMVMESIPSSLSEKMINDFHKAIRWFRINNTDAYYTLLD